MTSSKFLDIQQECPAVADKPARRETMPKIAPVRNTSSRQINKLVEVMEIRRLVIKFLIQITSTYSS